MTTIATYLSQVKTLLDAYPRPNMFDIKYYLSKKQQSAASPLGVYMMSKGLISTEKKEGLVLRSSFFMTKS